MNGGVILHWASWIHSGVDDDEWWYDKWMMECIMKWKSSRIHQSNIIVRALNKSWWRYIDIKFKTGWRRLLQQIINKISYWIIWQNNSDQKTIVLTCCNRFARQQLRMTNVINYFKYLQLFYMYHLKMYYLHTARVFKLIFLDSITVYLF